MLKMQFECSMEQCDKVLEQYLRFVRTAIPAQKKKLIFTIESVDEIGIKRNETEEEEDMDSILLTIPEANKRYHIGENKLRNIAEEHEELVLWNGNRCLFKRAKMDDFLKDSFSI